MNDVRVVSLVYYEHKAGEYVLPHDHTYHELVYYHQGHGYVNVGEEVHPFEPGSVFIVKPGHGHDEVSDESSIVFIVLFQWLDEDPLEDVFILLEPEIREFVHQLFHRAIQEYRVQNPYYLEYVNHMFNLVILETLRQNGAAGSKDDDIYVRHAKKYIRENYIQNIDFSMLAKSSGYSYDRFRHLFKEATGTSLKQYLINVKLDKAKAILAETTTPIKAIAHQLGFSSIGHFVNFFTARMNIAPMAYRKMLHEENKLGVVNISARSDK